MYTEEIEKVLPWNALCIDYASSSYVNDLLHGIRLFAREILDGILRRLRASF